MGTPRGPKVTLAEIEEALVHIAEIWSVPLHDHNFARLAKDTVKRIITHVDRMCGAADAATNVSLWPSTPPQFETTLTFLDSWCFPNSHTTRRRNSEIEQLGTFVLFTLGFIRAIFRKPRKSETVWSRATLPRFQSLILAKVGPVHESWRTYLFSVLDVIWSPQKDQAATYVSFSRAHQKWYKGLFGQLRADANSGGVARVWEHAMQIAHSGTGHCDIDRLVYGKLRKYGLASVGFFLCSTGTVEWCRVFEAVCIFHLHPPLNSRHDCNLLRDLIDTHPPSPETCTRHRPGQWKRQPLSVLQSEKLNILGNPDRLREIASLALQLSKQNGSGTTRDVAWSSMSFHTLYIRKVQTRARTTGVEGPLTPAHDYELLAIWLGFPKVKASALSVFPLQVAQWARAVQYIEKISRGTNRAAALAKVQVVLRIVGIHSVRPVHLSLPPTCLESVKSCVARAFSRLSCPDLRAFFLSRLRWHRTTPTSFSQAHRGHREAAGEFHPMMFRDMPADELKGINQLPTERVFKSLDVPTPSGHSSAGRAASKTFAKWCADTNVPSDIRIMAATGIREESERADHAVRTATNLSDVQRGLSQPIGRPPDLNDYSRYIADLSRDNDDICIPCDRDPKGGMWIPRLLLWVNMYLIFCCDAAHFVETGMTHDAAVNHFQALWDRILPKRFRRIIFRSASVPFRFLLIKEKCFPDGVHSCVKDHVCWREVVSCARDPARHIKRLMGKCLICMAADSHLPHWEVSGLHSVGKEVRAKFAALSVNPKHVSTCRRCGKEKDPVCAARGDISRQYTEVNPELSVKYVEQIIPILEAKGYVGAAIARGRNPASRSKPRAFLTKKIFSKPGTVVFSFSELVTLLRGTNEENLARLGQIIIKQKLGIGVGDALSGLKAAFACRRSEHFFMKNRGKLVKNDFISDRNEDIFESAVCILRYADDVLIGSTQYCADCLDVLGGLAYEKPLEYKPEEHGPVLSFVDLHIRLSASSMRVQHLSRNWKWACGAAPHRTRHRYAPHFVGQPSNPTLLFQWISGSMHSVHASTHSLRTRTLCNLETTSELVRIGHPLSSVRRAIKRIQHPKLRRDRTHLLSLLGTISSFASFDVNNPSGLPEHVWCDVIWQGRKTRL